MTLSPPSIALSEPNQTVEVGEPILSPPHFPYIEIMRALAILMVIGIHVASAYVYNGEFAAEATANWKAANWIMGFLRPAVPLFIMISGALLLQPSKASEPIKVFFKKRILRVLVPFALWSAVFAAWRLWFLHQPVTLGGAIADFFQGGVYIHFWFMYVLLALYIVTPILRQYTKQASRSNLTYALGIWLVASILLPFVRDQWGLEINLMYHIPITSYAGFYLAGYYLSQITVPHKLKHGLLGLYVALALLTSSLTQQLTQQAGGVLDDSFYNNPMPNTVLMSICLFLWLKELPHQSLLGSGKLWKGAIVLTSRHSFGIYLIHLLAIDLFQSNYLGFQLNLLNLSAWFTIPLFSLLILGLCLLILKPLSLLPGGQFIAP